MANYKLKLVVKASMKVSIYLKSLNLMKVVVVVGKILIEKTLVLQLIKFFLNNNNKYKTINLLQIKTDFKHNII